ncbi:MAG: peptidoglycan DD-metalloendopeptidase family protein [Pseudomonadota bacterium]
MRLRVLLLVVYAALAGPALAQDESVPDPQVRSAELEDERDVATDALERLRANLQAAQARQEMLRAEIEAIDADVGELTDVLIRTTSQAERLTGRIEVQRERIAALEQNKEAIETSLDAQRTRIASLLSAMVRVGREPPPALAVSPGDALRSVRSALLLGVAFPELEAESRALANDLSALADARLALDEALEVLLADAEELQQEEERIELLLAERSRVREENQAVLERERERAALLANDATSLEALLTELESELSSVREAIAEAEAAQEAVPDASDDDALALLRDSSRITPAFAFGSGKGMIQRPVRGVDLLKFGEPDRFGIASEGVHIAARAGARVVAPADGWVLYAGPFRTYGQVVILDVGDGYRMVLAGMSRINVALGQFVLMGEPVATMGNRGSTVLADGTQGAPQPVLFVELREDGRSIDSSAWWAETDSQRTEG